MNAESNMPLDEAMELADHASPAPAESSRALRAMRAEIERLRSLPGAHGEVDWRIDHFDRARAYAVELGFAGVMEALQVIEQAKGADALHPSHVTRSSDASTFDEVCVNCGATDMAGGGWGELAKPCKAKGALSETMSTDGQAGRSVDRAKGAQGEAVARPMSTAPRDGTLLRLLVRFDEHALDDSSEPQWTIGQNSKDHTEEDVWQFAGWCWEHDHFTEGEGTPIGWLPMLDEPVQDKAAPAADVDSIALHAAKDISLMWGQDRSRFVAKIQVRVIAAIRQANTAMVAERARVPDGWRPMSECPRNEEVLFYNCDHRGRFFGYKPVDAVEEEDVISEFTASVAHLWMPVPAAPDGGSHG